MAENLKKKEQTRSNLRQALIELCMETDYHNISIAQICKRSGVYRSTFYRYYASKDDLLSDIENCYIEDTRNITRGLVGFTLLGSPENKSLYRQTLTRVLEYHRQHRELSRFLLSPMSNLRFSRKMEDSIAKQYEQRLERDQLSLGRDQEYIIRFYATGFVASISKWLKHDDLYAEELAQFLTDMIEFFSV